jgi:beta-fructofuranosidase
MMQGMNLMKTTKLNEAIDYIKENKHKLNKEYRLSYHLMGEFGWINDPNGFIQYKDMYHLFYQHYPYASVWGPMHWGHAISKDLVMWEYLPIALAPDSNVDSGGCFSGSAIEKENKLYIMYTGHVYTGEDKAKDYVEVQNIASSVDGRSFTKLQCNPVIGTDKVPKGTSKRDIRDPKIFKRGEYYYTVLGSNDEEGHGQVLLYKSSDLINWNFVNVIAEGNEDMGVNWECPDVFQLEGKDVLIISPQYMKEKGSDFNNLHSCIYMIGDLDVEKGIFEYEGYYPTDYGFNFYAPQSTEDSKGRRIIAAWMSLWETQEPTHVMGHNWAGAMTLPREVILKDNRLYFKPIDEIKNYRKNEVALENFSVKGERIFEFTGDCYELQLTFDSQEAEEFGIKLRVGDEEETVLSYNKEENSFKLNLDKSGLGTKGQRKTNINLVENKLSLQIFVDKSSVEVFINGGEKVMTARIFPCRNSVNIKAFSLGECTIVSLKKWDILQR